MSAAASENVFYRDILEQPGELAALVHQPRSDLTAAVDLIRDSRRLVLTSMGSAFHSLQPAACELDLTHPNLHLVETAELLRRGLRPEDTLLVMSRSGESREVVELAQRVQSSPNRMIAITMTPDSTLAACADVVVHDPASYDGFICTKAYTTMALLGLLLVAEAGERLDALLRARLSRLVDWLAVNMADVSQRIADVEWLGSPVTFLSHGAGMAVADAGALWFQEAVRARASVSSWAAFEHGPIEQVDETFCAVWVDLQPDERSRAAHDRLLARGARLFSVVADAAYPSSIEMPGFALPPSFRTVGAAVPLQLFAYWAAHRRGLDPGTMRYLEWVVR